MERYRLIKCMCMKYLTYGNREFIEGNIYSVNRDTLNDIVNQTFDEWLNSDNLNKGYKNPKEEYLEQLEILTELMQSLKPLSEIRDERIDEILSLKSHLKGGFLIYTFSISIIFSS